MSIQKLIKGKILIVEDEKNLGDTLFDYLVSKGHECLLSRNVQDARQDFRTLSPHIVLMDIGLPDGSGLELAKEFRSLRKDFVLLFLSAQNDPNTRVQGLEIGAEDFITKPFALKELMIRLERILSAKSHLISQSDDIQIGKLKIYFKRYEVVDAFGTVIPLSQKECAILNFLYQYKNQVVNRDLILDEIWGKDVFPTTRTVDNYIVKLRKWCESDETGSIEITSVRGVGYKLSLKS